VADCRRSRRLFFSNDFRKNWKYVIVSYNHDLGSWCLIGKPQDVLSVPLGLVVWPVGILGLHNGGFCPNCNLPGARKSLIHSKFHMIMQLFGEWVFFLGNSNDTLRL
jgi:hypothetical protein